MNGWKNYETWAAYTWLTNEEGTYNAVMTITEEHAHREGSKEAAVIPLGDALKGMLQDAAPDLSASLWEDLLQYAINQIDFYELATAFLE